MMVFVAFTIGMVFWIVGWALGAKAFDAFLVTILLTLIAATVRTMLPYLNKRLKP
jgi:hypothetical protein